MIRLLTALVASLFLAGGIVAQTYIEPRISNEIMKDMGAAYGYTIGQQLALDMISKQVPSLRNETTLAKAQFDLEWLDAVQDMERTFEKYGGLDEIRTAIEGPITEQMRNQRFDATAGMAFINDVKARGQGQIASPFIETLLIARPSFRRDPIREMQEGYRQTWAGDGSGKAKGLSFGVTFPKSWKEQPGVRPNVAFSAYSEKGRGTEGMVIVINELDPGEPITKADVQYSIRNKETDEFAPPNAVVIETGYAEIEGYPGFWQELTMEVTRGRLTAPVKAVVYQYFIENHQMSVSLQTMEEPGGEPVSERFERYLPLFDNLANQIVIYDPYLRH